MVKVAHCKQNRFVRTLNEIKISINLQSISSKVAFSPSAYSNPLELCFLTCQRNYWTKEEKIQNFQDDQVIF